MEVNIRIKNIKVKRDCFWRDGGELLRKGQLGIFKISLLALLDFFKLYTCTFLTKIKILC